jgi:hypothetical protein
MRDSNSRGVGSNTLSKSVGVRSRQVSAVCDLELRPGPVLCECSRTAANETRTETGVPTALAARGKAVRIGSDWTDVLVRSSVYAVVRHRTATRIATVPAVR